MGRFQLIYINGKNGLDYIQFTAQCEPHIHTFLIEFCAAFYLLLQAFKRGSAQMAFVHSSTLNEHDFVNLIWKDRSDHEQRSNQR